MNPEVIDSHTHLDAKDFDTDREQVIARARAAGVKNIVTIGAGYGLESAQNAVNIAAKHDFVYCSIGLHPHDAKIPVDLTVLRKLVSEPKVVAIGETGLDFFRDWAPKELQEAWFRAQIEFALEVKKPLIIHSREAGEACLSILSEMKAERIGGVFHCYDGDADFAKKLSEINFLVSFPGSVTFKKADKLRETVKAIPVSQMMVETDAPFLAPEPNRGKRCESAFVIDTARKIAELKGLGFDEFAEITTKTAQKFFKLSSS